jgi:hypothetical protein
MFLVFVFSPSFGASALGIAEASAVLLIPASAPGPLVFGAGHPSLLYVVELRIEGVHFGRFFVHTRTYSRARGMGRKWTPYSTEFQSGPCRRF